jgi:hypothetical protein
VNNVSKGVVIMRRMKWLGCWGVALFASGCANRMVVGTWTADKSAASGSPIARATFCSDGTFTAEAEYGGGKTHAMSGTFDVCGDKLKLTMDGTTREYGVKVSGDEMTMTHDGKSARLMKMKGKIM